MCCYQPAKLSCPTYGTRRGAVETATGGPGLLGKAGWDNCPNPNSCTYASSFQRANEQPRVHGPVTACSVGQGETHTHPASCKAVPLGIPVASSSAPVPSEF
jgi:hypothetical protein